jgi:hypothetical protein
MGIYEREQFAPPLYMFYQNDGANLKVSRRATGEESLALPRCQPLSQSATVAGSKVKILLSLFPSSQKKGRRAHFTPVFVPHVPQTGTEGTPTYPRARYKQERSGKFLQHLQEGMWVHGWRRSDFGWGSCAAETLRMPICGAG